MTVEFLHRYDAYLVDVDGVLLRGSEPIAGSVDALTRLAETGRVLLLTNNSTRSRGQHADCLARLGFRIPPEWILPTSYLAARYLLDRFGPMSTWVLGEAGLRQELVDAGHVLAEQPEEAEALVVGMDRQLDYDRLTAAYRALAVGARLVATNEDGTYPVPGGFHPGAGAMVGALRGMGFSPSAVVGKPSPIAFRMALRALGAGSERVVVIGDRLETDIQGGHDAGLDTAVVLSGISSRENIDAFEIRPTWIADDLAALVRGAVERPPMG